MISFLGVRTDGQTDTVLESSYGNKSAHKKNQLKAKNKELAVDPYSVCLPGVRGCMKNMLSYLSVPDVMFCNLFSLCFAH